MTTKEILEMLAKLAASAAAVFAAIALFMNARTFKLQRRALEANLFNDIKRRISDLEDQHSEIEKGEAEKLERWYYKIFSAFESFAFYANRDYLTKDMVEFYSTGIEYYAKRLEKFPKLRDHFKKREEGEFCELEEYYRKVIKKPFPF